MDLVPIPSELWVISCRYLQIGFLMLLTISCILVESVLPGPAMTLQLPNHRKGMWSTQTQSILYKCVYKHVKYIKSQVQQLKIAAQVKMVCYALITYKYGKHLFQCFVPSYSHPPGCKSYWPIGQKPWLQLLRYTKQSKKRSRSS